MNIQKPHQQACHFLLAKTAKEIAGAQYEEWAHNNVFYKSWPNRRVFIRANWPDFIPTARDTLAKMLEGNLSQTLKDEIFEALMKDHSLRPSRG